MIYKKRCTLLKLKHFDPQPANLTEETEECEPWFV